MNTYWIKDLVKNAAFGVVFTFMLYIPFLVWCVWG
jgi:hypothetical protein